MHKASSLALKDRDTFFEELEREIARVRRYAHRITLLLIEPEEELEGEDLERLEQEIVSQLRTSDSAFHYSNNQFTVIMPDTHEAGGEAAALRLKRKICSAMNKTLSNELALSIGVISLDASVSKDAKEVAKELEKDLERDKKCQAVDLKPQKEKTCLPAGEIIFTGTDQGIVESINSLGGDTVRAISVSPDEVLSVMEDNDSEKSASVVVLGPLLVLSEKQDLTQKIRFNRKLGNTYIVWVQDESMPVFSADESDIPCDIHLPSMPDPELLWPILRYGFSAVKAKNGQMESNKLKGMLDAIGSTAHQLNQPLQIIMGRLELLLLNMDETPENQEMIKDIKNIRSQALLAADINKKIGRLSKY